MERAAADRRRSTVGVGSGEDLRARSALHQRDRARPVANDTCKGRCRIRRRSCQSDRAAHSARDARVARTAEPSHRGRETVEVEGGRVVLRVGAKRKQTCARQGVGVAQPQGGGGSRVVVKAVAGRANGGRAAVGVGAGEDDRAGIPHDPQTAGTANSTRNGDCPVPTRLQKTTRCTQCDRTGGVERQVGVIITQLPSIESDGAVGSSELGFGGRPQHAAGDRCAAGVSVDARESGDSGACLDERAGAGDRVANGNGIAPVEGQRAVVGHIARSERADGAPVADLQRAAGDGCRTGVGVVGREHHLAVTGLYQGAGLAVGPRGRGPVVEDGADQQIRVGQPIGHRESNRIDGAPAEHHRTGTAHGGGDIPRNGYGVFQHKCQIPPERITTRAGDRAAVEIQSADGVEECAAGYLPAGIDGDRKKHGVQVAAREVVLGDRKYAAVIDGDRGARAVRQGPGESQRASIDNRPARVGVVSREGCCPRPGLNE